MKKGSTSYQRPTPPGSNRLSDRVQHLVTTMQSLPKSKITSFLDIGCGNAEITDEIGKLFKIDNVFGADVYPVMKKDPSKSVLTKYYQVIGNHIDLPEHSMDLITCFMSIHHFENFNQMVTEICRLLKPSGLLFLREHDVPKGNLQLIRELNDKHTQFPDHIGPINYWSRSDLQNALTSQYHFVHITDSNYPNHINNKQSIYHALYQMVYFDQ